MTKIGKSAFSDCGYYDNTAQLTLTIPNGITNIGKYAFYNVNNIEYQGSQQAHLEKLKK